MRIFLAALALVFALFAVSAPAPEAPTGFDNKTNGLVDDATHQADQAKFDEVEQIRDGLGPLYNAQSCRECHQSPVSGGASQVSELRVGHLGPDRRFRTPDIPIGRGIRRLFPAGRVVAVGAPPMALTCLPAFPYHFAQDNRPAFV